MKTKSRNFLLTSLTMIVMMLAILFSAVAISPLTAYAASSVRVDFCLTNGALENNVFFENDSSKYFMSQQTKADGTLTSLEELYRTDNLDLEFDGWYTEKGEKVSLETVFTEYTILYDRWKPTTLTDEDIISTLEIGTPLLEVGQTAGTYDASSILLTDNRLSVQSVYVYEGLNAYRTNKLEDSDVLETGKSYSLRVELHTKNGALIDDQLTNNVSASYGLVANMVYSHDNSGIFTTKWTNRENKIQVIINYDYENYYFTSDLVDKIVENGQSPQYTVYVSNNASIKGMELFVANANGTWASLGAVTGQFNVPANSNVVKQYRVEVTYQNGFVISSNTFSVDWYDPNAPKFITQPTDYDVAYGTNVQVSWALNFDSSSIVVERKNGENWVEYQSAYNDGAHISPMPESGTYTFRAHATKNGVDYYSNEFTITWREKFEFTTQPQSMTVVTGEAYTITWKTNQTPSILQVWFDDGTGNYRHIFNINDTSATSFTFNASDFAYSRSYKLMANYDNTVYFSDIFTIDIIAGEFTSKPDSTINAIVGNDCLVEWDFTLDVKYYNIKVHDGNDFVQFATTNKPEYIFTASEVGEKQFFIQAYNANDEKIGEDYLLFTIKWTKQQIVYLVSFNANDGTGTMQPVEQIAGSQYTLPTCTFTAPDGKIFKAWSVNDVEKNVGDKITINANTVIKAVWEDNEVIYSYCTNGAEGSNDICYATVGEEITLDDCMFTAPAGKRFKAWAIGSVNGEQKQPGQKITITEETYIYAIWEDIPHECIGILESGQGATCTVDGWKDYYRCECGKYYEDANCTIPINDLAAWKVGNGKILAAHSGTAEWIKTATTHEKKYTCCQTVVVEEEPHAWQNGVCTECEYTCQHSTVAVTKKEGQAATCTVNGWRDYYQCTCGKYFADEARTAPIADLEAWKVGDGKILAKHEYGNLIPEKPAVHTQTELKAGMRAHYYCSVCETYFDENKVETTQNSLIIPAPTHSFGNWVIDDEKHWKVCDCGLKSEENSHDYTDNSDMTCNTCGYDRTVPHTHGNGVLQSGQAATCTVNGWKDYYRCECGKYYEDVNCQTPINDLAAWKVGNGKILAAHSGTPEWIKTATTHEKKYTCCDTVVIEQEQHEWNNGACSECGYTCQHTNISVTKKDGQGATCTVDGWKDYYQCACGKYFADEARTTPIADLEAWKIGDGKIVAEHTYGDLIPEKPAVHTQTELQAGMHAHYYCSECGTYFDSSKNETTAIALTIPAPTHSFGDWVTDDAKHWKVCDCGLKSEENSHDYTDNSDMTCNTCGYDRTVPHTHGNGVLQSGQAATCTVNGWKDYYKCSCGKIYTDAACTNEITSFEEWKNSDGKIVAEHTYGSLITKVNATCSATGMEAHYECSVCHTLFDENKAVKTENELTIDIDANAHTYGAWTSNGNSTHSRVCSINGDHKETVACSGGTATCTEKAICEVCNTSYGEALGHDFTDATCTEPKTCKRDGCGATEGEALGHEAKNTWTTDANNHWHECTRCEGQQLDKAAHSGGTATCTEKAICSVCNTAYGNTLEHSHGSEWQKNADEHWNECACGDKTNKAAHTDENNDGKCDICDYAMGTPENPGENIESEKTGLSGGAIAGIAVGSVAVVVLGGFSLFWFVIKKKKFADLIALFKKK